jgi:hypothetical protein
MNIFILSWNVNQCAEWYCNQHVSKILLEICQMLYTAHHHHSPSGWDADVPLTLKGQRGYKKAHSNHPMTMWIRTHPGNYRWAAALGVALAVEHNKRFGTVHGCSSHIMWLSQNVPPALKCHDNPNSTYASEGFPDLVTPPPECMPMEYHHPNIITAYHNYYRGSKLQFARWS